MRLCQISRRLRSCERHVWSAVGGSMTRCTNAASTIRRASGERLLISSTGRRRYASCGVLFELSHHSHPRILDVPNSDWQSWSRGMQMGNYKIASTRGTSIRLRATLGPEVGVLGCLCTCLCIYRCGGWSLCPWACSGRRGTSSITSTFARARSSPAGLPAPAQTLPTIASIATLRRYAPLSIRAVEIENHEIIECEAQ